MASAYGVGNATLATNVGSDMVVDLEQVNTGGVDANAQFAGLIVNDGGEVLVSSTAIGNAFTRLCLLAMRRRGPLRLGQPCDQRRQHHVDRHDQHQRRGMIAGSATAIGNSATFITTQRNTRSGAGARGESKIGIPGSTVLRSPCTASVKSAAQRRGVRRVA